MQMTIAVKARNAPEPRSSHRVRSGALLSVARLAGVALALMAGTQALANAAAQGDWKAGRDVYFHCTTCHALAHNARGPKHCGLFGRRAGSVQGFAYSNALLRSNIVWNEKTLDRFLENPQTAVPGTVMGYLGVKDPKQRADVIAFLKKVNKSSACRQ
jgi:cytochrome c